MKHPRAVTKIVAAASVLVMALFFAFTWLGAPSVSVPDFEEVRDSYRKSDAVLLDRHGEVIHELRVDFEGRRLDWTPLDKISPALIRAVLHSEDRRFYKHRGVDWLAIPPSIVSYVFPGRSRGGSTIPMQLTSMLDHGLKPSSSGRRSITKKLSQMKSALRMEETWSKDEILEAYLNLLGFRGEIEGVAAASRGLFGKEPGGLDGAESLILASLIRSPNASTEDVTERACRLGSSQGNEVDCSYIKALAKRTLAKPYSLEARVSLAPHVARGLLEKGRTRVRSTLDAQLQRFALELLRHYLLGLKSKHVGDGAILVVENKTGEVLAYVANTGAESSAPYVDGIQAKRQAGSTLKPFLYGLAFEERILTPASPMEDEPIDVPTPRGIYSPENYDNQFKGMVPARVALASSLNVPAVRTLSLLGEETFVRKLKQLGFGELRGGDYYGLSLALGTADVSLWELVNAYRTLANGGLFSEMTLTFEEREPARRVFAEGVAFIVSDVLSDREARSATFSLENPLSTRFWSAVKTGTSKDMRDNWCAGYSSDYSVGVWVGNFSGEPMWDVSGMSGAAPLWFEIMNYLHAEIPSAPPSRPPGVVMKEVVFHDMGKKRNEYFLEGTASDEIVIKELADSPRILYPPAHTIIALDPDVPKRHQRLFFESSSTDGDVLWVLDGKSLGHGNTVSWSPERGSHTLSLVKNENTIDEIRFQVR